MIDTISTILWGALGALIALAGWEVVRFVRRWSVDAVRLGPNILTAEPRIRRIVEHTADDMTDEWLHRLTTLSLTGIDHSAAVIRMAAVMLEIGRHAGMSTAEVLEFFPHYETAEEDQP